MPWGAQHHVEVGALEGAVAVFVDDQLAVGGGELLDELGAFRAGDGDLVGGVGGAPALGQPWPRIAAIIGQGPEADVADEGAGLARLGEQPGEAGDDRLGGGQRAPRLRGGEAVDAKVLLHVDDDERRVRRLQTLGQALQDGRFHGQWLPLSASMNQSAIWLPVMKATSSRPIRRSSIRAR